MIHDYYLSKVPNEIKDFDQWDKEKENLLIDKKKKNGVENLRRINIKYGLRRYS